jgi:NADPH-dependent 2,4-dienoyl-CoA reductase/sulfur reductase-like enzyme
MPREIAVAGGMAAGPKVAARVRRRIPEAHLTIVEQESPLSYAGCGVPYFISGQAPEARDLICMASEALRDAAFFKSIKNIDVLGDTRAESIDRFRDEVSPVNLDNGMNEIDSALRCPGPGHRRFARGVFYSRLGFKPGVPPGPSR